MNMTQEEKLEKLQSAARRTAGDAESCPHENILTAPHFPIRKEHYVKHDTLQEEKREKLERSSARAGALRSRQAAAGEEARPPALQRVAELVPGEGPLSVLWACLGSDRLRLRVVTRHRKGVRGIATGMLLS